MKKALRAKFKLFGRNLELIVDSGASCCLLSKKYIPEKFKINTSLTIEVRGVNGITHTLGFVDTIVGHELAEYPVRFHIMEQLPSNVIGLIGTNFLKQYGAQIDFAKMKMEFTIPNGELHLTIPPRHEYITYIETEFAETCVVLNQKVQPNVFVANSIANPVNGKIPIRLVNISNKPAIIKNLKPTVASAENYNVIDLENDGQKYEKLRASKLLEVRGPSWHSL